MKATCLTRRSGARPARLAAAVVNWPACLACGLIAGAVGVRADEDPTLHSASADEEWTRHFRLGVQVGLNVKASFSLNGAFGISGSQPGLTGVTGVEHLYDDGYVRVDQTGNGAGYTSFWGYSSAAQYNAANQTLQMHSARSFTYSGGDVSAADEPYIGADLVYGVELTRWGRARIGADLGFGWLPMNIQDQRSLPAVFTRTVHEFSVGGITIPTAPYNGGSSGVGPTIHDVATALPDQTVNGTVTGSRSLDVSLYNVRLGPSVYWPLHPKWALEASAGFALGIVSGDYRFDETTVLADGSQSSNRGSIGTTELTYGGYVNAMVLFHAARNGDVFLGAQFMPLGSTSVNGGGRAAHLDLSSGVYLTAGFNWPF